MVLEGNGFSVDTASNGQEGLEKARQPPTDLILMDMQLPGVDGLASLASSKLTRPPRVLRWSP